jgi:hypothetical protein
MRIVGEWRLFSDGVTRPIVTAEMAGVPGESISVRFLVDSGADCTALNAATLEKLGLPQQKSPSDVRLRGITGDSDYVTIRSTIEFKRDDGGAAKVRGEFLGLTDPDASDLCVLDRDVTDNFDLILSRPRGEVLLLAPKHHYQVVKA